MSLGTVGQRPLSLASLSSLAVKAGRQAGRQAMHAEEEHRLAAARWPKKNLTSATEPYDL